MLKRLFSLALCLSAALTLSAAEFTTRTYQLEDFTHIQVSHVIKVVYTQADTYSVKLTGRQDWLDKMEVTAKEGLLKVALKKDAKLPKNIKKKDQPDGQHNFILQLTAPCLQNVNLSGVSSFETTRMSSDGLSFRLSGVSKVQVEGIECDILHINLSGVSSFKATDTQSRELEANVSGSSNISIQKATARNARVNLSGASKLKLPSLVKTESATFGASGASKMDLQVETSGKMQVGLSGASKSTLTYKGGHLRTYCSGASKLEANVDCQAITASCDGASKATFSGTADKVEIERGSVATNINTSNLNKF